MSGTAPCLLIVDDDAFVREVTVMSFTSAGGWDVHAVDSGAAAIELLDRVQPDVILLDFVMPDMDGPTTLAAVRARPDGRDVPVVFVTADERAARTAAARADDGVVGVIAKPYDPMTLPDQVRAWIEPADAGGCTDPVAEELAATLAQLWKERRPETIAQLDSISAALDEDRTDTARGVTHNLVGVLGSLGLVRSSELGRTVDRVLRRAAGAPLSSDERAVVDDAIRALRDTLATELPSL